MKPFDFEAAKRGAAVCTRDGKSVRILCFDRAGSIYSLIALKTIGDSEAFSSYTEDGEDNILYRGDASLMMRDDDYLERQERGEYRDHIADVGKMVTPTVEEKLTVATCKESLPVGLTKREWFAGMAMAGEIAGFLAGQREVNGEERGIPTVIAEDAVLFADALVAELEKTAKNP